MEYIERWARRQGKKWSGAELGLEIGDVGELTSPSIQYIQRRCLRLSPSLSTVSAAKREKRHPKKGSSHSNQNIECMQI